MNRAWILGGLVVTAAAMAPAGVAAQDRPPTPPAQQDSLELRAEREIFSYPSFERRNPFKPLTTADGGPRFELMRLEGVIFSTEPGRSVALVTAGGGSRMTDSGMQTVRGESARLRVGERWGNVRVVEIRRDRIIVDVTEFGLAERREMRLPTRSQGGS